MRTSPSISNLSKALLKAQKETGAAIKDSSNPYFKSKYANLGAVMEVVKQAYNNAGILILQPPITFDGKNYIETTLIHAESGEFMASETEVICAKQNDPQAFVAATTYARRAGLQAMTFTPAEDDDGETAMGRGKVKPAYTPKATPVAETSKTVTVLAAPIVAVPPTLPAPVTTAQVVELAKAAVPDSVVPTTITDVKPLKTSSFRKPKTQTAPQQTAPAEDPFN